jgi:hypothetical protein
MALNSIGPWGRAASVAARHLRPAANEEPNVEKNVQMEALITFSGDYEEGVHPAGSVFFTTEGRAHKYERGLPRLARRLAVVSVSTGKVKKRAKPAVAPDEFKAPKKKPAAKKKAAAKKPARKPSKTKR